MAETEQQLQQLIDCVRQAPDGSLEWRTAMGRLLVTIQGFPEYQRYSRLNCPDYFLDALNRTWEWVCREFHRFEPRSDSIRQDLLRWINAYLYWRLKDLAPGQSLPWLSLDGVPPGKYGEQITSWLDRLSDAGELMVGHPPTALSGLDVYLEQQQQTAQQDFVLKLELYIETDPEDRLRQCHPRRYPQCNGQVLSQRLCLKEPPDKLARIAREFGINYQSLVSHWKLKVLPLLRTIAIELGYSPSSSHD